jgi:DNA-binding GntR family transcriptional regulator
MQTGGQRVARSLIADQCYQILRQQILEGSLLPRARLAEPNLAQELGSSRTPVREALRRLEREGLVERSHSGGLYVTQLTREDASEVIGIRAVLEAYAAKLATQQITEPELASLRRVHEEADVAIQEDDVSRLVKLNTDFHDQINAASRTNRCIAMIAELRDSVLRYRRLVLDDDQARMRSFRQHGEILAAMVLRDAKLADELVHKHIASLKDEIIANISDTSDAHDKTKSKLFEVSLSERR